MPKNFKSPGCIIGLLIAGALILLLFGSSLGSLFGGGGNDVPVTGGGGIPSANQGNLGQMFVASQVTNEGCPADQANQFNTDEPVFVGLERSDLPRGASVFARLYQDGQAIEDTNEIVADRAMNNTCVWFAFEPRSGGFEPGDYTAEIIVNGNTVDRAGFAVGGAAGSGLSNADVELGQMYTATGVTQGGCPVDDVDRFYADEPVYVALDESFIPAGTEVFARLLHEGQPVEDTDAIVADQDLNSCVWFAFEPQGGGFDPGNYEAQIYVNGQLADRLAFTVR